MKFAKIFVAFVAVMVFSASFAFAADDVSVSVRNDNTNNPFATGGNANQNQNQDQKQKQQQKQKQNQRTDVKGISGNQIVTTPLQAPLMGAIVGPGGAEVGKEFMLRCNPDYQSFTIEELENMANSGSFFDRRGSFFDALTGMKVKSMIHSKKDKATGNQIKILNEIPVNSKVLGTFSCTGDIGWATDEILSKCLLEARKETNTSNVVVYKTNDIDATNSGTAVGAGTGMSNPFGNGSVGAGAVAASFGKTHSFKERVVLLEVRAYDDVFEASDVCVQKISITQVIIQAPEPPKVVEPPKPPVCNPEPIRREIERLKVEISKCKVWSLNNEILRFLLANAYANLAKCTGENGYYSDAIENYKLAEKNYLNGKDIKANQAEADRILYKVYWNWAAAIREVAGRDAEVRFAQDKKLTTMPSGINELKR